LTGTSKGCVLPAYRAAKALMFILVVLDFTLV
jgi:hypothetical protein